MRYVRTNCAEEVLVDNEMQLGYRGIPVQNDTCQWIVPFHQYTEWRHTRQLLSSWNQPTYLGLYTIESEAKLAVLAYDGVSRVRRTVVLQLPHIVPP